MGMGKKRKMDLEKISGLLTKEGFDEDHAEKILSFLSMYYVGEFIYPDAMSRFMRYSASNSKSVLEILLKAGAVKRMAQYYCPACGRLASKIVEEDLDEDFEMYCESCDALIQKDELRKTIYQVSNPDCE